MSNVKLHSNRGADDAAFLEDLEVLATQNRSFTLIPTLTRSKSPSWPYEIGPIDLNLLRRYLRGLQGPVYYVAGPSGMVTGMTALLQSSGVSEDDIKTEEFGDHRQDPLPSRDSWIDAPRSWSHRKARSE